MSDYTDKTIQCKDCGTDFVLLSGEQDFFVKKGFSMPVRCKDCRAKKKLQREQERNNDNRR